MARLPQPGSDSGNWGDILNDYLAQSHNADGSIKDRSVGSSQLQDDSVTAAALAPNSVTSAALAADSVTTTTIADGSITEPLLASTLQTKLNAPTVIADGSITGVKIAADSVSKSQLQSALRDELDTKVTKAVADNAYAPVIPTQRSVMVVGSDLSGSLNTVTDFLASTVITLPVTTTRWRLRIANRTRTTAISGSITVTGIYLGTPAYLSTGKWAGNFTIAPVQVLPALTLPTDGSDTVTAWVTDTTLQFTAYKDRALTYGVTCASGQTVGYGSNGIQHVRYNTGSAAQVGNAVRTGGGTDKGALLDVRLEVEHVSNARSVLVFGDSITSGVVDDASLYTAVHSPSVSWPVLAGLANRAVVANGAVAGTTYGDFQNAGSWQFTRFDSGIAFDDVILSHGINNISAGSSLTDIQTQLLGLLNIVRGFAIPPSRIFVCTLVPFPLFKAGALTSDVTTGATTLLTNIAYASGDKIDIEFGTNNSEQVTVSAASTSVSGGYSTPVSATTKNHLRSAATQLPFESTRQTVNTWLRTEPHGLRVIEMDLALRSTIGPSQGSPDATLWGNGVVHPGHGAYVRMAEKVRL